MGKKRSKSYPDVLGQEQCQVKFALTESDETAGTFRGIASVFGSMVDSWIPTIIERGAFSKTLQENFKRIKLLYQHDPYEPIGVPIELKETEHGLEIHGRISQTTRGKDSLILMRDRVLDELSIGFDPVLWQMEDKGDGQVVRHVNEVRLWEISLVTFAADPNAKIMSVHSVIPFQDLPLAEEDRTWSKSEVMKRLREACGLNGDSQDWAKFRKAHVWYNSDEPEQIGSYKLPIADIIDGSMRAVPRAIFAAAVAVQGGRGGLSIPDDELSKVRAHLGRYYAKMDRTAPWDAEEESLRSIIEPLASLPAELFQGFQIQTCIFPKAKWDSVSACRTWLKDHEFKSSDVDETEESWRFRQRDPADFERLRTICIDPSRNTSMDDCLVKAVGGPLKESQSFVFPNLTQLSLVPLEAHEGKVLSGKNKKLVSDAISVLQALLAAAEPPAQERDDQALTEIDERLNKLRDVELLHAVIINR